MSFLVWPPLNSQLIEGHFTNKISFMSETNFLSPNSKVIVWPNPCFLCFPTSFFNFYIIIVYIVSDSLCVHLNYFIGYLLFLISIEKSLICDKRLIKIWLIDKGLLTKKRLETLSMSQICQKLAIFWYTE